MRDRIPRYAGRVKLTPVANQQYTYDMVRADEPLQEGTPLNRNTLLSDQTVAEFGLSLDATPDEAMRFLNARRIEFENEVNSDVEKFKSDVLSAINESFKIPRGTAPALVTKSERISGKVNYSNETTLELNFDFNPKLIILRDRDKLNLNAKPLFFTEDLVFDHDGVTTDDGYPVGNSCTFSDDGNVKIVWYTTSPSGFVVGYVDKEYDYIAMGPGTPNSDDSKVSFTLYDAESIDEFDNPETLYKIDDYTVDHGTTWNEFADTTYDEDLGDYWMNKGNPITHGVSGKILNDGDGNAINGTSVIVEGNYYFVW